MNETIIQASLNEEMSFGIFSNADGQVLIIHEKEITGAIAWIEYDESEDTFSLIYENGDARNLGLSLNRKMIENLMAGSSVILARIVNDKIISTKFVTFITKNY